MDPIPLLLDLVAANSVNPSLVPGAPGEGAAAEVARQALVRAGLDVVVADAAPGRPNVVGVLQGREPGPAIMLCGHLDTVGTEGMIDPHTPRIDGGRLHGRGAQDMKGGVAAMIAAAAILAPEWTRGRLIVACVADEEHLSLGAEALVRTWQADMAVVTEPTDLTVGIGHKGFAWALIETRGRAAHGSRPDEGRDAITRMGRVLVALEARDRVVRTRPPVPFQGTGSLHASIVRGGRELSTYPDHCALEMERRTVSGEDASSVQAELDGILAAECAADPEFEASAHVVAFRPPYRIDAGHALVRALGASLEGVGRASPPCGLSFWTDAAILAGAGIPSVLFGPGGAGLHTPHEFVLVEEVVLCRDLLVDAIRRVLAGPRG